ncbi:CbrC family protein [Arthrobacter sp. GMC3]|uniref:CbrC family protein n=1 Tax=Arthrobacter sp. GMC3 TaxID=2058894 RepID=UPI0015E3E6C3|nr:CbrC family protein [Arthrobacter sp. GMC3]
MCEASDLNRLPIFRFHPNAYDLDIFEVLDGVCEACEMPRAMRYKSSFYAMEDVEYICPWCIADGTAARVFDGEFSDAAGIEAIPEGTSFSVEVYEAESLEVATCTPSYVSWQQEEWRSHCGRPCAFLGDIGANDLPQYLTEPDFAADVNGGLGWDPASILNDLERGGDFAGYLFRCLSCGAHRLHVDAC